MMHYVAEDDIAAKPVTYATNFQTKETFNKKAESVSLRVQ